MALDSQHINNGELLTRRELFAALPKAAAVAGAIGMAGAVVAASGCSSSEDEKTVEVLEVGNDDVVTLDSYTMMDDAESHYTVVQVGTMPAGSQLYSSDGIAAAALVPGETASPLNTVQMFDLQTGEATAVLDKAVGTDEGYSIFDVRGCSTLLLWVESNFLTDEWRVYAATAAQQVTTEEYTELVYTAETVTKEVTAEDGTVSQVQEDVYGTENVVHTIEHHTYTIGEPLLLEEGDADYDVPELGIAGGLAYWIVQPSEGGSKTSEDSYLRTSTGAAMPGDAYTSHGRFCAGLSSSGDMMCALPRADADSNVYYQLTAFSGGAPGATQILPHSYRPNTAIYLDGNFSFGINGSYDYGDGIANVGTYYPLEDGTWLRLIREPLTPLGSCQGWLYCKSGSRTVFVDPKRERYFTVNPPNGSEEYGDYQVWQGAVDGVVNYTNVTTTDEDGVTSTYVLVRRITPETIN